jgi:hypothetical protein
VRNLYRDRAIVEGDMKWLRPRLLTRAQQCHAGQEDDQRDEFHALILSPNTVKQWVTAFYVAHARSHLKNMM